MHSLPTINQLTSHKENLQSIIIAFPSHPNHSRHMLFLSLYNGNIYSLVFSWSLALSSSTLSVSFCTNKPVSYIQVANEQKFIFAKWDPLVQWIYLECIGLFINEDEFLKAKKDVFFSKTRKCFLKLSLGTVRYGIFIWFCCRQFWWLKKNTDVKLTKANFGQRM